jgi:lactoylglutathione lyase
MDTWVGQYCIYVSDLDRAVAFFEAIGLECTSRTDLGDTLEAIVENSAKGGKLQLAQKLPGGIPIDMGNAFWKLYVATNDIDRMYAAALAAGASVMSEPMRGDRWPMTIAFVQDADGYVVELTQRHPWTDGDTTTQAWLNQYCIYVSDLERAVARYEGLGLQCTSRTSIPDVEEAIVENPDKGGKLQLAQRVGDPARIDMGTSMWKLYLDTDDCRGLYGRAIDLGWTSMMEPMELDRWPVTVAFVTDPDGYQVELVERHPE